MCYHELMFSLILLIIFAIGFGYFATFNVISIPVVLGSFYTFPSVPLYAVIGIALLIGIVLAWLISLTSQLASAITLHKVKNEITDKKSTIHEMTKKVNELQIENANLKGELKNEPLDDSSL